MELERQRFQIHQERHQGADEILIAICIKTVVASLPLWR